MAKRGRKKKVSRVGTWWIRFNYWKGDTYSDLMAKYDLSRATVGKILKGRYYGN